MDVEYSEGVFTVESSGVEALLLFMSIRNRLLSAATTATQLAPMEAATLLFYYREIDTAGADISLNFNDEQLKPIIGALLHEAGVSKDALRQGQLAAMATELEAERQVLPFNDSIPDTIPEDF